MKTMDGVKVYLTNADGLVLKERTIFGGWLHTVAEGVRVITSERHHESFCHPNCNSLAVNVIDGDD